MLFFFPDGTVQGFFSKFQSQATETDQHGNPVAVGVSELDALAPEVRRRVAPPNPFAGLPPAGGCGRPRRPGARRRVHLRAAGPRHRPELPVPD